MSAKARSFVKECLVYNPAVRKSAKELIKHPWLGDPTDEDENE